MQRPMSFSDRQLFVQELAIVRNLSFACIDGEREDSALGGRCQELVAAIDNLMGELVGDMAYFHVEDFPQRA